MTSILSGKKNYFRYSLATSTILLTVIGLLPAQTVELNNLSAFKSPTPNWQLATSVKANPEVRYDLSIQTPGTGVLVNLPTDPKQAKDIYTVTEHGDADIEFEFMMANGSNSGVYLQGRYEIQLLDSWGKKHPGAGDCGGIYERWDDARPAGEKGYQGYAPRQNASRIAGVWQKMRISFQAPRFDKSGKKTENARILSIHHNDLLIHENVELTGPTRGGAGAEAPLGPIRIQGDHGPIAFRNIRIKPFNNPKPELKDLNYLVHDGRVLDKDQLKELKADRQGRALAIDNSVSHLSNNYVIRYQGKISVPVKGLYRFTGDFWGGYGNLVIGSETVFPFLWHRATREVELPAGELPIEYAYAKVNEGNRPGFGLTVSGPGIRSLVLHEVGSVIAPGTSNPIGLEPTGETQVHRSFIDFDGKKLPYGISVGTIGGVNYSMNLENGALIRGWRGNFLDVTPMWLSRGNGTSHPAGSVLNLSNTTQVLRVGGARAENFILKGYQTDADNNPVFQYKFGDAGFLDQITPDSSGRFLNRTVTTDTKDASFQFLLASGNDIIEQGKDLYLIDGDYFIRVNAGGEATIETVSGKKVLTISAAGQLSYAVIW